MKHHTISIEKMENEYGWWILAYAKERLVGSVCLAPKTDEGRTHFKFLFEGSGFQGVLQDLIIQALTWAENLWPDHVNYIDMITHPVCESLLEFGFEKIKDHGTHWSMEHRRSVLLGVLLKQSSSKGL